MVEETFSQQSNDYQCVERAIRFVQANFQQQPSLDEIANSVHLSKYHFQRLFKRWAGVTPSQYLRFLTIEYAKERLRESHSVLDVALEAGLSGPSRLYDLFVTLEAITPGEYRRRATGLDITFGLHDSPFGRCLLAMTSRGICGLHFVQAEEPSKALDILREQWPGARFTEGASLTRPFVEQIFAPLPVDQLRPFHLLLKGTNFQVHVWRALLTIPSGALVSYEDVAAYLGNPQSARAVAAAVARNPIAFLIPCHRVISKAGTFHRYRWGAARKSAILGWEASQRSRDDPIFAGAS